MAVTQDRKNVMAASTCTCARVENTGIIFLSHQVEKVKKISVVHNSHAHSCSFFLWRAVFKTHRLKKKIICWYAGAWPQVTGNLSCLAEHCPPLSLSAFRFVRRHREALYTLGIFANFSCHCSNWVQLQSSEQLGELPCRQAAVLREATLL